MAAVRHVELEFCHSEPPTYLTKWSNYLSKFGVDLIFDARDIETL